MISNDARPTLRIVTKGIPAGSRVRVGAGDRILRVLTAKQFRATAAQVRFTDDNGPKGGDAIRCTLTVKLTGRPAIHVEDVAGSGKLAFDGALAKLERRLVRMKEAGRKGRRYPTKYFAATRERAQ
jgi:ribosome-associated translation inhibitor RaiA